MPVKIIAEIDIRRLFKWEEEQLKLHKEKMNKDNEKRFMFFLGTSFFLRFLNNEHGYLVVKYLANLVSNHLIYEVVTATRLGRAECDFHFYIDGSMDLSQWLSLR